MEVPSTTIGLYRALSGHWRLFSLHIGAIGVSYSYRGHIAYMSHNFELYSYNSIAEYILTFYIIGGYRSIVCTQL